MEYYLNDEHYNIILFSLNGNKIKNYKWYPFLFDFVLDIPYEKNHNYIPSLTASTITGDYFSNNSGKHTSMDWHIMNYGLKRYVILKNDYKKCINIIFKNIYLGKDIYGIENAAKYYYQKNIMDISDEELISIILLSNNSTRYEINNEENKNKTFKIINEYKK